MPQKRARSKKKSLEPLEEIKRLLILKLILEGVSTEDIGKTLGVSPRTIQRLVSIKKIKKLKKS